MTKTKTKPVYQFKVGVRAKGLDPQAAGESLVDLQEHHGWDKIPHVAVVIAARKKSHPLHSWFEWDDVQCGKLHREDQARYLLRSIEVVRENQPPIRAFFPVELVVAKGPRHGYMDVEAVLANPVTRAQVLDTLKRKLRAIHDECAEFSKKAAAAVGEAHRLISRLH